MANASRPGKSSAPRTSRLSRQGALELEVALVAGEHDLGVRAARGLLRLRQAQLTAMQGAKGALVRLELDGPRPDFRASALRSPLLRDFFTLIALQLIDDFPGQARSIRSLLASLRKQGGLPAPGNDLAGLMLEVALMPVAQAIEQGWARHAPRPRRRPRPDYGPLVRLVRKLDGAG